MCYELLDDVGQLSYDKAVLECEMSNAELARIKNEQVYIALLGYLSHLTNGAPEMWVWLDGSYDVSIKHRCIILRPEV